MEDNKKNNDVVCEYCGCQYDENTEDIVLIDIQTQESKKGKFYCSNCGSYFGSYSEEEYKYYEHFKNNKVISSDFKNEIVQNLFLKSAFDNDIENFKKLCKKANIFTTDRFGSNALMLACYKGNKEIIEILSQLFLFNVDNTNCCGQNALYYAIINNQIDVVKLLIDKNIDIVFKDDKNKTPLDYAYEYENKEIITIIKNKFDEYIKAHGTFPLPQKDPDDVFRYGCSENIVNNIPGLGKDTPVYINKHGGKQSYLPYDFTLIKPETTFALANILNRGSKKYGKNNWLNIPINEHLNHALVHINKFLYESENNILNTEENDLGHAYCRLMMALYHNIKEHGIILEEFDDKQ